MHELKLYTIAQLRAWLEENQVVDSLSEKIIAPQRAYAIIHNPYVMDDDPVVAAIFVDGENVAYTSAFPEEINGKRYWWFSGLWCDPKHEGNGYGLIVVGSLVEVYGEEFCLDRWGAKETVEIFTYFGLKTSYTPRYISGTQINQSTLKGRLAYQFRKWQKRMHDQVTKLPKADYTLRYVPIIDEATFSFIKKYGEGYCFHHTKEFLNWVLRYSFSISSPLINKVEGLMPFSQSEATCVQQYAVQVWKKNELVGFYVLKERESSLRVLYLYFKEEHKYEVFASIVEHAKQLGVMQCISENKELTDYMLRYVYFARRKTEDVSFSYPSAFTDIQGRELQFADGDCFTA